MYLNKCISNESDVPITFTKFTVTQYFTPWFNRKYLKAEGGTRRMALKAVLKNIKQISVVALSFNFSV